MHAFITFIMLLMLVFYVPLGFAGKKHCQSYRAKLDNIQSQQRHGYSNKKGLSLQQREQKARDKWWQCETGKLKPKKKNKSAKKAKDKKTQQSTYAKEHALSKKDITTAKAPFSQTNQLVFKQRYQGKQLQQWLSFYQAPKGCSKPKSMKKFTECVEDKQRQQLAFEQNVLPD
ncbi:hypothetical protein [Thalassotalea sp. PLHSN55]|uniref:hypothetical protein n=1 Tax=Thalassotalea sp. PLHSN55 TaxID=3435888 RepID=UPI003F87FDE8